MPPSAQRKTRPRKPAEGPQEPSDIDPEPAAMATTPSRKRRRANNQENVEPLYPPTTTSARKKPRSNDMKVYEEEESFNAEDPDTVIRNLRKAKYPIAARMDYANEVQEAKNPEGKQAYAKIAGNGWTFYVDDLEVRIGRPPEERQPEELTTPQPDEMIDLDKSLVHIDLGPSKLVSRQHAEIRFDGSSGVAGDWFLAINGRNGARLDDQALNRGDTATLHSGSVIEIAGTQMMFIAPNEMPYVHDTIVAEIQHSRERPDGEEDDLEPMHPPSLPHRTPTKGSGYQNDSIYPSSSQRSTQRGHKAHASQNGMVVQSDGPPDAGPPNSAHQTKNSPTYPRGLMIESTEDIDYSQDSAKDLKPPHSYAQLISQAIMSNPEEKLTLSRIYDFIKERYAFYRYSPGGWQNSIRHNLSLNKSFEKVARRTDEPGKGMKWQIVPEFKEELLRKSINISRKTGRGSSGPNSPTKETLSSTDYKRFDNVFSGDYQDGSEGTKKSKESFKSSPDSTPPVAAYSAAPSAYTPERAVSVFGGLPSSPAVGLRAGISPFPFSSRSNYRTNGLTDAAAAGSPGGPRMLFGSETNDHFTTPLIAKHAPKLLPPSTARLPSQFMPMSSPAPFWKYADFGSTPAPHKFGLDTSPVKMQPAGLLNQKDSARLKFESPTKVDAKARMVHSSSPPLAGDVGQESPTRALSSRGGDKAPIVLPAPERRPQTTFLPPTKANGRRTPSPERAPVKLSALVAPMIVPATTANVIPPVQDDDDDDDGEEGGMIDLARGFQPIGSFHRNMSARPIEGR